MRVLLVNDDGPPAPHSPHILGLYESLKNELGWDVTVVLPSSQKSWGSMAFSLSPPCSVWYYYPLKGNFDGSNPQTSQSWSSTRRAIREDEVGEWILCDGSPTTCTNIGLHSIDSLLSSSSSGPSSPFDLVVSGPNFGRNTGTAFSLSSGTIGAALAASLSGVKAIAISYAHFHQPNKMVEEAESKRSSESKQDLSKRFGELPASAPIEVVRRAHQLSCKLVERLYTNWESNVGVYTVNVPLTYHLLDEQRSTDVYWTKIWESKFGQLFQVEENAESKNENDQESGKSKNSFKPSSAPPPKFTFKFAPNMATMLQPKREHRSNDLDISAVLQGHISVSRLAPSYATIMPSISNESSTNAPGSHFKL